MDLLRWAALVLVPVIFGAVGWIRRRRAGRRRAALASGADFRCRALLAGTSGLFRRGTVRVTGGRTYWQASARPERIDLAGVQVLSLDVTPGLRSAGSDEVLLQLAHPDGSRLQMVLHEDDASTVVRRLRHLEPAAAPSGPLALAAPGRAVEAVLHRPGPRWPWALLGVALLWALGWAWLWCGGSTTAATVLEGDGAGGCTVTWTDATGPQTSFVDCADEPVGSRITVRVMAWPCSGEAVAPGPFAVMILVAGAIVAGFGLWGLGADHLARRAARRRPARRPDDDLPVPAPLTGPSEPLLRPGHLEDTVFRAGTVPVADRLARLAPLGIRQVPGNGWEDPRVPDGARVPRLPVPPLRRLGTGAVALALVGALTAPWPYRWLVLRTSADATATAGVTGQAVEGEFPLLPDDVTVTFRDGSGAGHAADVAVLGALPAGGTVTVRYAVDDPGQARLAGPDDGLDRGAAAAALGVLAVLAWLALQVRRTSAERRALVRAGDGPSHPVLGLLTADPEGDPTLILCHPSIDPPELYAIAVRPPLPHGTAAAFAAGSPRRLRIHGTLAPGEQVLVELLAQPPQAEAPAGATAGAAQGTGAMLVPWGVAWRVEPDDLRMLLDSTSLLDLADAD